MKECIFCKIASHEIKSEIVFENDRVIAFRDIAPKAPVHIVIIPKIHLDSISSIDATSTITCAEIMVEANRIAKQMGIEKTGFRLVTNTGPDAGQAVSHLHFHLLGGKELGDIC